MKLDKYCLQIDNTLLKRHTPSNPLPRCHSVDVYGGAGSPFHSCPLRNKNNTGDINTP